MGEKQWVYSKQNDSGAEVAFWSLVVAWFCAETTREALTSGVIAESLAHVTNFSRRQDSKMSHFPPAEVTKLKLSKEATLFTSLDDVKSAAIYFEAKLWEDKSYVTSVKLKRKICFLHVSRWFTTGETPPMPEGRCFSLHLFMRAFCPFGSFFIVLFQQCWCCIDSLAFLPVPVRFQAWVWDVTSFEQFWPVASPRWPCFVISLTSFDVCLGFMTATKVGSLSLKKNNLRSPRSANIGLLLNSKQIYPVIFFSN